MWKKLGVALAMGAFFVVGLSLGVLITGHMPATPQGINDTQQIQGIVSGLESKNNFLSQEIYQANLTLDYYTKQTELYREKIEELEKQLN